MLLFCLLLLATLVLISRSHAAGAPAVVVYTPSSWFDPTFPSYTIRLFAERMTFSNLSQEKRNAFILDDIDPFVVASAMFDPLDFISPHLVDIALICCVLAVNKILRPSVFKFLAQICKLRVIVVKCLRLSQNRPISCLLVQKARAWR
jgi:hypothetical protein